MINIQKNVKLSEHSTFKIGGEAKEFVAVGNEKEFIEAFDYAKNNKINFLVLGGGSNILFDGRGFEGLIIKLVGEGEEIKIINGEEDLIPGEAYNTPKFLKIKCWAGQSLSSLVNFAKRNNLAGIEWATGIPGTVGGAISGNAGAFGKSMADIIDSVKVLKIAIFDFPIPNKSLNYKKNDCDFKYRESIFKNEKKLVILSAKIILQKGKQDEIEEKMKEFIKLRDLKQPKGWFGCAGSFFKNPIVEDRELIERFEKDSETKVANNRISAGWLIEEAGLKGKKVGNVAVSDVNANFIINNGGGTAEEIIMLASIIKQKVRSQFGVQLKEEVSIFYNN